MTEKREINGATYERTSVIRWDEAVGCSVEEDRRFFRRCDKEASLPTEAEQAAARAAAPPDVVCECGSAAFELRYGNYEIFARCAKCGAEESVYSG